MPEASFIRKFIMLSSGTVIGQALIVASSPLLTRLFTPTEFGLFAIFSALVGICGVVSALRFEFAIPIAQDDADAAALVKVAMLASLVTAGVTALAVHGIGAWFLRLIEAPQLAVLLWFLPVAVLLWGVGSALVFWSIRRSRFNVNGLTQTLQFGGQAFSQVGLGFVGAGTAGLILGYLGGYVVRLGHHLARLPAAERRLIAAQPAARLWDGVVRNWRYPAFVLPSSFLQSACQLTPAILISILYGPALAGLYALSQRIVGLPVRLFSEAASHVFLGELRNAHGVALHRLFVRTLALFTGFGVAGALPILLFGPPLFALLFGEPWRAAGVIVQLLLPLHVVRFIVLPISQLLYSFNRQDIHLFSSIGNAGALIGSFAAGYVFELDAYTTILIYSVATSCSFLFYLAFSWRLARNARALPWADVTSAQGSNPVRSDQFVP